MPRFDSPAWLATAAAALALLLLARRAPAARAWWSGTVELAREIARAPRGARGARRLPPASAWCAACALLAGGLALAGPRAGSAAGAPTWTVHVDASPSMFLAWAAPGTAPAPGAPTRLERALELAARELAGQGAAAERTRWRRSIDGVEQVAVGAQPPPEWRSAPAAPQPPPAWPALDAPGCLWLSDDAGGTVPRAARACLSGGAAVPGPVAALGPARLAGTGAGLALDPAPAPAARVALEGLDAAGALVRIVDAWCAARGVERVRGPAELVLATAPAAAAQAGDPRARAGRDGWTWELAGPRGAPPGTPWLGDARGALVAWRPGRIELAGAGFGEPEGDPAAFAGSWSELLDRACLPPAGVVPTAEREGAGEPRVLGPGEPPPEADRDAGGRLAAPLALLAGVLAAAALALSARG